MLKSTDLKSFLKALDDAKNDYVCKICSELSKNPVTLSKCFHIICGDHFEGLKRCPDCNVSLEGCTAIADDRLDSSIESAKKLSTIFEPYRTKRRSSSVGTVGKTSETRVNSSKPAKKSQRHDSLCLYNYNSSSPTSPRSDEKENLESHKPVESLAQTKVEKTVKPSCKGGTHLSATNTTIKLNKAAEKRNKKGETELHIACRLGKIEKVQELLGEGAMTNTKDNAGWTPLHEAVQNGNLNLVRLLLQHNALINVPGCSNETPLHEAVRFAKSDDEEPLRRLRTKILEELVHNGADLNARNCKGETPIQLATPAIKEILVKASENLVQTQSVNISMMSEIHSELDLDDVRIYCISKSKTIHMKLKSLAKQHSNLNIEAKFNKKVTHLIVDTDNDLVVPSVFEVLQGIVNSLWILSSQWVSKSTDVKLERFEDYEVKGVNNTSYNGPKLARYNKYKQFPGLFDGCHFYLHNFGSNYKISKNLEVSKQSLSKLIIDADGVILRRVPNPEAIPDSEKMVPYHADRDGKLANCSHFIIFKDMYVPMYNMSHLKALPIGWLIECIEKYELVEPDVYTL